MNEMSHWTIWKKSYYNYFHNHFNGTQCRRWNQGLVSQEIFESSIIPLSHLDEYKINCS